MEFSGVTVILKKLFFLVYIALVNKQYGYYKW
jgi:hypothetical protein